MADLHRYRFGYCTASGIVTFSEIYDDFGLCYSDYVCCMQMLKADGADLSLYQWRGVFNLEQAAKIIMGVSVYDGTLTVVFGG